MIALGTPFALGRTAPGPASWLVGGAVLVTFMGSYVLFRDWDRFGRYLLRHPWVLAVDMFFSTLLLVTATPESPLGFLCVCTPLLAGLVYGWRGSAVYAAFQALIVVAVYAAEAHRRTGSTAGSGAGSRTGVEAGVEAGTGTGVMGAVMLPCLCLIAGAAGVCLRNLMFRFGAAGQALTETRARLAVAEAVHGERARLARDMHDSVAKTLHGLALAAEGLAASAGRTDPDDLRERAELVARAARRAAAESRELLADLRRDLDAPEVDLTPELMLRIGDFTRRTALPADFVSLGEAPLPPVPQAVARQLLTITEEALENAHRHAGATRVSVGAGIADDRLRITIRDDGCGLPPGTTLESLRRTGHFGLVGMSERAAAIGAALHITAAGPLASRTQAARISPVRTPSARTSSARTPAARTQAVGTSRTGTSSARTSPTRTPSARTAAPGTEITLDLPLAALPAHRRSSLS
ncbi:sensor histidine kinase [Streptomyces sp. NPDC002073]